MSVDVQPPPDPQTSPASAFWWRLTDNAFRRWYLFLLPVILLAGIGAFQSTKTLEVYRADGRLNATGNPLVPDAFVGAAPATFWDTPSDITSRMLDEQLLTDSFVEDIAVRANLMYAIENGLLDVGIIRSSVWTSTSGSSLVTVSATWDDPATALALVEATITGYQGYITETVASDSREAVDFYSEQLASLQADVVAAQTTLSAYVADLPVLDDGEEVGLIDALELERLTTALTNAEAKVQATEDEIEAAELSVRTAESDAGRSLTVIDAPLLPVAPESTIIERLSTIVSYTVLGLVIGISALLVSTVLERSIVSERDLVALTGVSFVAAVPVLRTLNGPSGRGRRRQKRENHSSRGKRSSRGSRGSRKATGDTPVAQDADADADATSERAGV